MAMRVLLVEDNPGDSELTKATLEAGTLQPEITVVADGVEALDYLFRKPPYADVPLPDLILLDLNLPRMDGRAVLAEIKNHADMRRIPVVVLTSSDAGQDIAKSYDLGANCYVTKPVGLMAYRSIVRSVEYFWTKVVKLP